MLDIECFSFLNRALEVGSDDIALRLAANFCRANRPGPFAGDSPLQRHMYDSHVQGTILKKHEWRVLLNRRTAFCHVNFSLQGLLVRCQFQKQRQIAIEVHQHI